MTTDQVFVLVFVLFYVWECLVWVPFGSVVFSRRFLIRWRTESPSAGLETRLGAPWFAFPIPPMGRILSVAPLPFGLNEDGIVSGSLTSWLPVGRPRQSFQVTRFDSLKQVTIDGKKIFGDEDIIAQANNAASAKTLARFLQTLIETPREHRNSLIETFWQKRLDLKAWQARSESTRRHLDRAQFASNILFLMLVVVLPAVIVVFGLEATYMWLFPLVFASSWIAAGLYFYGHRQIHPNGSAERWTNFIPFLFFPPAALRVHDYLSRDVASDFHPSVLIEDLLDSDAARSWQLKLLRDLRTPIRLATPLVETARKIAEDDVNFVRRVLESRDWFRAHLEAIHESPDIEANEGYCPRCHTIYSQPTVECPDCRIELVN